MNCKDIEEPVSYTGICLDKLLELIHEFRVVRRQAEIQASDTPITE